MVNTEDFIKRLEIILDYYSLNASGFADKIGVQRSSLSHLLSGEINLAWIFLRFLMFS
jgi:predicted transcriptional regulator